MGDIIPAHQLQRLVDLSPSFGKQADGRLTKASSMEYGGTFWLNKYHDKEMWYALEKGGRDN